VVRSSSWPSGPEFIGGRGGNAPLRQPAERGCFPSIRFVDSSARGGVGLRISAEARKTALSHRPPKHPMGCSERGKRRDPARDTPGIQDWRDLGAAAQGDLVHHSRSYGCESRPSGAALVRSNAIFPALRKSRMPWSRGLAVSPPWDVFISGWRQLPLLGEANLPALISEIFRIYESKPLEVNILEETLRSRKPPCQAVAWRLRRERVGTREGTRPSAEGESHERST